MRLPRAGSDAASRRPVARTRTRLSASCNAAPEGAPLMSTSYTRTGRPAQAASGSRRQASETSLIQNLSACTSTILTPATPCAARWRDRELPASHNDMSETSGISYRDSGVEIDAGDALVERIKPLVKRAQRPEVLAGIGGFGALIELPAGFRRPVLVAGTDGVGTKLRLAIDTGRHDTIGIDLVAMCANDVVVQGAEPLFFLDYFATGKLDVDVGARVIAGIVDGCVQAGCALVGGETAEMPGMYHGKDYDLAGFCVGIVEKDRIIDGSATVAGDVVLGLPSSGPHSNGFSLVRKILQVGGADARTMVDGAALIDLLMA